MKANDLEEQNKKNISIYCNRKKVVEQTLTGKY
jgi:hypothetical protein